VTEKGLHEMVDQYMLDIYTYPVWWVTFFLSNFYPRRIDAYGRVFKSVELA